MTPSTLAPPSVVPTGGSGLRRRLRAVQIAKYAWDASRAVRVLRTSDDPATRRAAADRLVRDTADAGVLFVKMSQFVAARGDVLDDDTAAALGRLQDDVPCVPPPVPVVPGLEGYVVDPVPVASASVASVFSATSAAGDRVAIKAVRPGVRDRVATDLPLLEGVLRAAAALDVPGAANMLGIVVECRPMLEAELDLRVEARAQDAVRRQLAERLSWVRVPAVRLATRDHMVSEFVESRKITDARPCEALAHRLFELFATMALATGRVHADPHAGNVGVRPDGTLVLYDFGAVVDVRDARAAASAVVTAAVTDDVAAGLASLTAMGILEADAASARRVRRILPALRAAFAAPDVNVALAAIPEFGDNRRRLFRLSTRYVYLIRALVIVQGLVQHHDPSFSLEEYVARPRVAALLARAAPSTSTAAWDVAARGLADAVSVPGAVRGTRDAVTDVGEAVDAVGDAIDDLRRQLDLLRTLTTVATTVAVTTAVTTVVVSTMAK